MTWTARYVTVGITASLLYLATIVCHFRPLLRRATRRCNLEHWISIAATKGVVQLAALTAHHVDTVSREQVKHTPVYGWHPHGLISNKTHTHTHLTEHHTHFYPRQGFSVLFPRRNEQNVPARNTLWRRHHSLDHVTLNRRKWTMNIIKTVIYTVQRQTMISASCSFTEKRLPMRWEVRRKSPSPFNTFRTHPGGPRAPTSLMWHRVFFPGMNGRSVALTSRC